MFGLPGFALTPDQYAALAAAWNALFGYFQQSAPQITHATLHLARGVGR